MNEKLVQPRGHSKHHRKPCFDRKGRLYKAERKYRRGKEHTGKTKTLRDHRS